MKKQYALFGRIRQTAHVENVISLQKRLERASKIYPLSEMQLWRLKMIIGPYKFEALNLKALGVRE